MIISLGRGTVKIEVPCGRVKLCNQPHRMQDDIHHFQSMESGYKGNSKEFDQGRVFCIPSACGPKNPAQSNSR